MRLSERQQSKMGTHVEAGLFAALSAIVLLLAVAQIQAAGVEEAEARLLAQAEQNIEQHRKGDALVYFKTRDGRPVAGAKVQIRQTRHDFLFGCIAFDLVWADRLHEPEVFKKRFADLFNFAVFPFYWARYEPQQGTTMRDKTSEAVQWCRENGITTKGHPLVWTNPSGVPKWLRELPAAKSEELLLGRVRREVGGFAGQIDIWDVVNEPIHCRTWSNVEARDYVTEPVEEVADYVDKAFRAARQANPKAHLVLNEYYTIAREQDRDRFCQLVIELKRRGTPISGLGIQAHEPREHWFAPKDVWATFDKFAELGYPLHVTEYIPQSGGKAITGGWREGTWTEAAQAEYAEQFFRLCFGHPAVVSVNWWGFTDRRIWLPGGGLLTKEYEPKPVYRRLRDLLHAEWKTNINAKANADGRVVFRGFYGAYEIVATTEDGRTRSYQAVLRKGDQNKWVFTVQ